MVRQAAAIGPFAFVVGFGAAAFMLAGGIDFCLDDAWIHLAYAKSLRLGDGFSYNPGDHATGFSSPLWVLLIAALPWGSDPVLPVKLLGAACHAATAWGAASLTGAALGDLRSGSARLRIASGALVCALDPALVFAAVSGMEVALAAALVVWSAFAMLRRRWLLGAVLAASAVWARPEALLFLGAYSLLRLPRVRPLVGRRDWLRELAPLLAAVGALLVWMAYCLLVSGYPFPNTYYAKRNALPMQGALYFALDYLPNHAWFVSLTGFACVVAALVRPGEARRLAVAWLAASLAIMASRELVLQVRFFHWRYFAVLAGIPCVALGCALPARRWLALCVVAPVLIASVWMLPQARALQRAEERNIRLLHTEPSRWLARTLPSDSRVLVEGAGATRFRLPRTIRVIDAVGLNLAAVVHAADARERLCAALRLRPTHALLPVDFAAVFEHALVLMPLREFADTGDPFVSSQEAHITAARVVQIESSTRDACAIR